MAAKDDDWPAMVVNLWKVRKILSREGADPKVSGNVFKAVTQAVLLFWEETGLLTPRMERSLSNLQHKFMQRLTGRQPGRRGCGSWEYPPLEETMVEAGFEGIITYITRRHNTVAQYIATRLILNLCERSTWRMGATVSQRWWE